MSPRPWAGADACGQSPCPSANASSPGQLVLRQPAARVEHVHLVRKIRTPVPQHQVAVLRLGARSKTRNQNTGNALRPQSVIDGPGCRALSPAESRRPGAGHVRERNRRFSSPLLRCQISDAPAVHLIRAQHAGVDPMCETLVGFLDRCHDGQRQIKRRHAFGIESGTPDRRSITGSRLECPTWIMRPVAGSDKPQAKPPKAI